MNDFCYVINSEEELIATIFQYFEENIENENQLYERGILALKNETVNTINDKFLKLIPNERKIYTSDNTVLNADDRTTYRVEFLNSLETSGVPSDKTC